MKKDKKQEDQNIINISELGEFKLIDILTADFKPVLKSTITAIGDDTAVIDCGDKAMLITKDLLVEGIHFDIAYTPLKHLGYKSVVVNLSDIYAMNGTPTQIVVGIAISSRYTVDALKEFYEGIKLACDKYKVDLVGGDTCSSASGLFISVTAVGTVDKDKITYRKGAKKNDLICVSGNLGAAYAGLLVLQREKKVFMANPNSQPDIENYSYVLERQLKPEASKFIIEQLNEMSILPTSMIDVSDGLASEIMHICKNSRTGAYLYEDKIPIDPETISVAEEFNISPVTFALSGGEDYELLFTVGQEHFEKLQNNPYIKIIGYITNVCDGLNIITADGKQIPLRAQGWDAFKNNRV
ncbi:MAG: thiamine-phosphate kinase [Bacteroidetes bacterium]|nr:thiamine-phosphate kinase [Bacteroidota bacterium]